MTIQVELLILGSFVHESIPDHGSFYLKLKGEIQYKENMRGEESAALYSGLFLIKHIKLLLRIGLE